jgi:hypothetical protein
MPRCGDCENYRGSAASGISSGVCSAQKTGEKTYKLVMYHDDTSKCSYYKHLDESEVRTDSRENPLGVASFSELLNETSERPCAGRFGCNNQVYSLR